MAVSLSTRTKKKTRKGPPFEREVSKILSEWISKGERDDLIWRTSGSGARAKTRSKQGKTTANSCGDLKAEHPMALPLFEFLTIELKNGYKDYSIQDLLDKPVKGKKLRQIEEFYLQSQEDSKNAGVPFSLLILKKDRRDPVLMIPRSIFESFFEDYSSSYILFSGNKTLEESVLVRLKDFLEEVDFKTFCTATKKAAKGIKK